MISDVRRAKFTHYFHVTDTTGDGIVRKDDYLASADKMIAHLGLPTDSQPAQMLKAGYERYWESIAEADSDGDNAVTMEEWINHFNELGNDPELLESVIVARGKVIIQVFDTDHDNQVSLQDWASFWKLLGYPESEYQTSFQKLDRSGNGFLTFDELVTAGREFFSSDDPDANGNWLHGDYTKYL